MIKLDTYTVKGTKGAKTSLPKEYEAKENLPLLAQAIRVYENIRHKGTSKTKTRGEVVASTRKIYRQKGTGRARHGALSAPIFVGGGKAHGAKKERRSLSLPKALRKKSLAVALSIMAKEGKLVVVSDIEKLKKTKDAANLLHKFSKIGKRFTVFLSDDNKNTAKVFRNIDNTRVMPFSSINAYNVYKGGVVVLDKAVFTKGKQSEKGSK